MINFDEVNDYKDWPKYKDGEIVSEFAPMDKPKSWRFGPSGLFRLTDDNHEKLKTGVWQLGSKGLYFKSKVGSKYCITFCAREGNQLVYENDDDFEFRMVGSSFVTYGKKSGNFCLNGDPEKFLFQHKLSDSSSFDQFDWFPTRLGIIFSGTDEYSKTTYDMVKITKPINGDPFWSENNANSVTRLAEGYEAKIWPHPKGFVNMRDGILYLNDKKPLHRVRFMEDKVLLLHPDGVVVGFENKFVFYDGSRLKDFVKEKE
ncbi:MAG: hypothetical protein NTW50_05335 [Candidatus Berkelbacteria bacterium]|nr:hypothetical protein [Candidatus Berkelbacteria bacterium]